jgi:hypothetical protein
MTHRDEQIITLNADDPLRIYRRPPFTGAGYGVAINACSSCGKDVGYGVWHDCKEKADTLTQNVLHGKMNIITENARTRAG